MDLKQFLRNSAEEIVSEASNSLARTHLESYEKAGLELSRQRLRNLCDLTVNCVEIRNLQPIRDYASQIAQERFTSGFDLHEVQMAFNVLEEAIWRKILEELKSEDFAEAIGLISTVLGAGKDKLATTYVSLASETEAPSIDLSALFRGTDSA